ncbi:type II toxin-antitoxin system HipA family toxin [Arthrobacter tumbae]|uniref:type II toxin-antitoxin system HipA family toxin n=1 Tax=Arthrobacter tumbae TaxID=163874 RepID=UPI001956AAFF|nr:HipA domain-containing protein [Arthrobacter tumbae]MBM7782218.1 serine/threonine-protein kinase HipA [Arthrobacter tumbae]
MKSFEDVKGQRQADVYKRGVLAARLERYESGTRFSYLPEYLVVGGPAVAASLPLSSEDVIRTSGAVPPFFAGLLPEGRRLSLLRRAVKTSMDDELSLLLAVGGDTVGDVRIVPRGSVVAEVPAAVVLDPKVPVDFDEVMEQTGVDPSALAGVQDKLSAGMISLPVEAGGKRFILKLDPPEYRHVVENEFLMYSYARRLKIPTSAVRVVRDVAGRPGLLVERFDRDTAPQGELRRLAVEDATQILGLHPAAKYDVPYEQVCRELIALCDAPLPALRNLALQLVFAWLTGNGDLHAKNVSLLQDALGGTAIAPIYDIPSTVVYGDRSLALPIAGKRTGISRKHLLGWMEDVGLPQRVADRVLGIALNANGALIDDLRGGAAPFSDAEIRSWVKELKNRRRLVEE